MTDVDGAAKKIAEKTAKNVSEGLSIKPVLMKEWILPILPIILGAFILFFNVLNIQYDTGWVTFGFGLGIGAIVFNIIYSVLKIFTKIVPVLLVMKILQPLKPIIILACFIGGLVAGFYGLYVGGAVDQIVTAVTTGDYTTLIPEGAKDLLGDVINTKEDVESISGNIDSLNS